MLGTEQNSKVFERHGVTKTVWRQLCQSAQAGEKSGRTHPVRNVRSSGNHDARKLACQWLTDALSEKSLDRGQGIE